MKRLRWIVIAIILILLILPVIQLKFKIFNELPLYGIENLSHKMKWTMGEWFSGDLQNNFEKRFAESIGFRGLLVRINNQFYLDWFKDLSNRKLVLGKNDWLFERGYVTNFNKRDALPAELISKQLAEIKKLQDKLQSRGIVFTLVVSPSKADIYPEYLPDNWINNSLINDKTNYQKARLLLKKSGVNYIDAVDYFLRQKSSSPYTLFTKGGTHWSYYSACQVNNLLIKKFTQLTGIKYKLLHCDPPELKQVSHDTDFDIAALTNLYNEYRFQQPTPYPSLQTITDFPSNKPSVLFVGDSFVWTILQNFEDSDYFAARDYLYYDRINYSGIGNTASPRSRDLVSLNELLLEKYWVIIEVNEVGFDNIGYGFVQRALEYLNKSISKTQ